MIISGNKSPNVSFPLWRCDASFLSPLRIPPFGFSQKDRTAPPRSGFSVSLFLSFPLPLSAHMHTESSSIFYKSSCLCIKPRLQRRITLEALSALQGSGGPKPPNTSDFCHAATARLDNWRWEVKNCILPHLSPLRLSVFDLFSPTSLQTQTVWLFPRLWRFVSIWYFVWPFFLLI